jgi:NAD(P)-dependent dehydrogenase (short-subunit alcohol dehydrogenase family)
MSLQRKTAVIYGAGGAIGGVVARTFAREGARVFMTGRTPTELSVVAKAIVEGGGVAETAQVDPLDEQEIERHAANVVRKTGAIDVSFNLINIPHVHGKPLVEQCVDDFAVPVMQYARSQFLTATTAARYMITRRSGVILMMTAPSARIGRPLVGAFGTACAAVEAFARTLAAEVGPHGVRVVCLRSSGPPEETDAGGNSQQHANASGGTLEHLQAKLRDGTTLRRLTTLEEVANVATFVASEHASAMTATSVNLSCGLVVD